MFFRHPSKRALREWLNADGAASGGRPGEDGSAPEVTEVGRGDVAPAIDDHLATCHRCAAILDEMAEADEYALGDALAAFYTPPPDLSDRLQRRVAERLDSRVVLDVVTDLFGAGIETSKLLLMEEPDNE